MHENILINIGCGHSHHAEWINCDLNPSSPDILNVDITKGLPFNNEFADACYSSHVIEHLDRGGAKHFIGECFRVLRPQGVIRIVLPDLESLVREYLAVLGDAISEDKAFRYEWLMLEMYDQCVRSRSGGEMKGFIDRLTPTQYPYVRARIGKEFDDLVSREQIPCFSRSSNSLYILRNRAKRLISSLRFKLANIFVFLIAGRNMSNSFAAGVFRDSGEIHRWMYDKYSIDMLLRSAGFAEIRICDAMESRIKNFTQYSLDSINGVAKKPDSLYVEAIKP